jgi:hypothetical protein
VLSFESNQKGRTPRNVDLWLPISHTKGYTMTEDQVKRGLHMIRYTGILVTVLFFITVVVFTLVINNLISAAGVSATSTLLPYIIGLTIGIAVLFVVVYLAYGALQRGRITK